jgi:hypothetical protein
MLGIHNILDRMEIFLAFLFYMPWPPAWAKYFVLRDEIITAKISLQGSTQDSQQQQDLEADPTS